MSEDVAEEPPWAPWRVVPESGFEVDNDSGSIGMSQVSKTKFVVSDRFRFADDSVEQDLYDHLTSSGKGDAAARTMIDKAKTFTPRPEKTTDLASVPVFLRWFENPYGIHTLAAILHDELIVDRPNDGALRSDTLSDRFFRKMLEAAGVPWLKRWIMWAAVALRTRWAAGGVRRLLLALWILLAVVGVTCFGASVIWAIAARGFPVEAWTLLAIALVLPFVSALLWGGQRGASVVAAIAGIFVIPAAGFVLAGLAIYHVLEGLAKGIRGD